MRFRTEVPGRPVPYSRVRAGKGNLYLPARYRDYRRTLSDTFALTLPRLGPEFVEVDVEVSSDLVVVEMDVVEDGARPKYLRGDLDNYQKAVFDALEDAERITNDRQVVRARVRFTP